MTTAPERCAFCGSTSASIEVPQVADYITGQCFQVCRCTGCDLAATTPRPRSLDVYYPPAYRRYGGLTTFVLRRLYLWKTAGWVRHLPLRGRALEVGCGPGWMLRALRDRGWQVSGNERDVGGARVAAKANGIPTFVGDLDAVSPAAHLDLVILFQVLEHLQAPVEMLRQSAAVLAPGGVMVVAVPNIESWQARAFGRWWFHLDVPRHLHHFTPATLAAHCDSVGLQVVRTRFVSFEHDPYGWIQSSLNWLGFPPNLLTRMIMGMDLGGTGLGTIVPMLLIGGLLVIPGLALSVISWMAGAGALLEVWAVRRDAVVPAS